MKPEASLSFSSRRSPVISRYGIVATSQPLAVAAGLGILAAGGAAVDAAVATAAALNVTEPTSTGIGGDCFALIYEAATRQVFALNGSGRAPAALTLERAQQAGFTDLNPAYHPYSITVPGACAAWDDLIQRFGRLTLERVLSPAIRLAETGFPVAPVTAHFWANGAERQLKRALGGEELLIEGRAPEPGELFRNPGLARTLRCVAEEGPAAFYTGEIASTIAQTVRQAGGCLTEADLAAHRSTWDTPISTTYRDRTVWECPPNGQELAALIALNILEGFEVKRLGPLSAQRLHLEIEAMRLAFADTRWYIADPSSAPLPLDALLSKTYAAERRRLINPRQAHLDFVRGSPTSSSDTVYVSVVDAQGNACSLINSNYSGFGTGIVPKGWGFTLQNRGSNFSLQAGHPNALAPGKRPYHTMIPAMLTYPDGELFASLGVMGGFMQPQGHLQVINGLVDDELDPQAALDRPRFCIHDGTAGGEVSLESGISSRAANWLRQAGHPVRFVRGHNRAVFGRGQIILREHGSPVWWAGSDPRADGCAFTVDRLGDSVENG
jgi:gamma-glutamyltranspeptidase/glutathione hydrolase